jgi:hypothetical protein
MIILNEITRFLNLKLYFNFKNYIILVSSNEEKLLKKLESEFYFFKSLDFDEINLEIQLNLNLPPEIPSMVASQIEETCCIYEFAGRQYQDYHGKSLLIKNMDENLIQIFSRDEDEIFELSFLTIHSYLGMALDKKGFSRIHALGFSLFDSKTLVMLPSKGGKSTLLSHLIEDPNVKIISDDMPLISISGDIHSFPSKISLATKPEKGSLSQLNWDIFNRTLYPPKYIASLSQLSERIDISTDCKEQNLVYGLRLSHGKSILTKVSKWKMIMPLFKNMIIGIGLPQIIQHILTYKLLDFFRLFGFALMRSICAVQLLMKSNCYYFYMGHDIEQNVNMLKNISHEQIDR